MTREQLQAACNSILSDPALKPAAGVTHCNQAVRAVALAAGCQDFPAGMMANAMVDTMAASWRPATGEQAHAHAQAGGLAVAGEKFDVHGHVAVVYPALDMAYSPSWAKAVPWLANVGKDVGLMPTSHAFPVADGEPVYYLWGPEGQDAVAGVQT